MGSEKFGVRVGKIINRYCVAKHFLLLITDNSLSYERPREKIEAEAHLDRMYVIRTSVCAEVLEDSERVKAYKSLSQIKQEFLWDSGKTESCNETHFWTFSPSKFSDVADEFGDDD